jgi:hypothetical protein
MLLKHSKTYPPQLWRIKPFTIALLSLRWYCLHKSAVCVCNLMKGF